jgi:hypothetical protein
MIDGIARWCDWEEEHESFSLNQGWQTSRTGARFRYAKNCVNVLVASGPCSELHEISATAHVLDSSYILSWPRHSSSNQSLASHSRRPSSLPGLIKSDLWWTKWRSNRFFSEYFGFPCQSSFHQVPHSHNDPVLVH